MRFLRRAWCGSRFGCSPLLRLRFRCWPTFWLSLRLWFCVLQGRSVLLGRNSMLLRLCALWFVCPRLGRPLFCIRSGLRLSGPRRLICWLNW